MPKKISQVFPRDPEMSYKGTKGGAPGGKEGKPPKAALRNASFLSLKRLTPAGVGGFLLLLGSLLTALWDPLCSFWHPSGSYWDPLGALLAHIGTVLVPFRARFGLFCTLGGLLLARFGRNSIFKAEICKKTLLH